MKRNLGLMFCGLALLSVLSCFDPSQPNYQYFPDMYESVGYDTYAEAPFLMELQHSCLSKDRSQEVGNPMTIQTQMRVMSWQKPNSPHRSKKQMNIVPKEKNSMRFIAQYVMVLKAMDKGF